MFRRAPTPAAFRGLALIALGGRSARADPIAYAAAAGGETSNRFLATNVPTVPTQVNIGSLEGDTTYEFIVDGQAGNSQSLLGALEKGPEPVDQVRRIGRHQWHGPLRDHTVRRRRLRQRRRHDLREARHPGLRLERLDQLDRDLRQRCRYGRGRPGRRGAHRDRWPGRYGLRPLAVVLRRRFLRDPGGRAYNPRLTPGQVSAHFEAFIPVPEPASLLMLGIGAPMAYLMARKRLRPAASA